MDFEKMFENDTGEECRIPDDGANDQYNDRYVEWLKKTLEEVLETIPHNFAKAIAEVQPIPDMDLTKIWPEKGGKYTVSGKPVYPDSKHKGRIYSSETFDRAVKDYEKTNNSDKEDI